jgi:hypothetical protein
MIQAIAATGPDRIAFRDGPEQHAGGHAWRVTEIVEMD